MTIRLQTARLAFIAFVILALDSSSASANSTIVGVAVASTDSSVSGGALQPGSTILSGDDLRVRNGSALVTMGAGSHMLFGPDTEASFERTANEVTAFVAQGTVTLYQPHSENIHLRLRVDDLSILPAAGFETLGEIAMNGGTLVVTTKEGLLRLEGSGSTMELPKGKWIKLIHRAARSPQAGAASTLGGSATWIAAAGAVAAAVLGGFALHEASQANDAAKKAEAAAAQADADAKAALAAANQNNNALDCALDALFGTVNPPSPFVPQGGTCP
jgi:hypothetical protein